MTEKPDPAHPGRLARNGVCPTCGGPPDDRYYHDHGDGPVSRCDDSFHTSDDPPPPPPPAPADPPQPRLLYKPESSLAEMGSGAHNIAEACKNYVEHGDQLRLTADIARLFQEAISYVRLHDRELLAASAAVLVEFEQTPGSWDGGQHRLADAVYQLGRELGYPMGGG